MCLFATFSELFCDQSDIQYEAYSEVPPSQRPPSMADELHKYMQIVDDRARQVTNVYNMYIKYI
jgi:hypothetical protein